MSLWPRFYGSQCAGKIGYATWAAARRAMRATTRLKKDSVGLQVYHCVFCGLAHFGRAPSKRISH